MRKLWRDIHILKILYSIFMIGVILLSLTFINFNVYESFTIGSTLKIIFLYILPSFLLINLLIRIKLTYIAAQGIRVGNAPDDMYVNLKLNHKPIFVKWENIKSLQIMNKQVARGTWSDLISYLLLKTKNGETYETFISNPKSFIQKIKYMKKSNLISKDSKYI